VQVVAAGVAVVAVAAAALAAVAPAAALGAGWERAAVEVVARATGGWAQIAD
jgi:type IV secretory pathway VirB2 component (pilin)